MEVLEGILRDQEVIKSAGERKLAEVITRLGQNREVSVATRQALDASLSRKGELSFKVDELLLQEGKKSQCITDASTSLGLMHLDENNLDRCMETLRSLYQEKDHALQIYEQEHETELSEKGKELDELKSHRSRASGQLHQLQEQSRQVEQTIQNLQSSLSILSDTSKEEAELQSEVATDVSECTSHECEEDGTQVLSTLFPLIFYPFILYRNKTYALFRTS